MNSSSVPNTTLQPLSNNPSLHILTDMPSSFEHLDSGNNIFRANLLNAEDVDKWVDEYRLKTSTTWNLSSTKLESKYFVYRRYLYCHLKGKKNCPCKIDIKIKQTYDKTMLTDDFLRFGLPAIIQFKGNHNHELDDEQIKSMQRPLKEVKKKFSQYFENGLGPAQAFRANQKLLLEENPYDIVDSSNSTINPQYVQVKHLFESWKIKKFGTRSFNEILEKLTQRKSELIKNNVIIEIKTDPFAVLVLTETMQKSHQLTISGEVVFVDTTPNYDNFDNFITMFIAPSSIGGIPLGVIITDDQTEEAFTAGFQLLKNAMPNGFGGQGYPKYFMTDDSQPEQVALQNVWPFSRKILGPFFIGQAVRQWIRSKRSNIVEKDRHILYGLFKNILLAKSVNEANEAFEMAYNRYNISGGVMQRYENWERFISEYWNRKEAWCGAWIGTPILSSNTNKFYEVDMRTLKENIFSRSKTVNSIALVNKICYDFEPFYQNKIMKILKGQYKNPLWDLKKNIKRCKNLSKGSIIKIDCNNYGVPKESDNNNLYVVDSDIGVCTCILGCEGKFCKHQAAVIVHHKTKFYNAPSLNDNSRCEIYSLLTGHNVPPYEYLSSQIASEDVSDSNFESDLECGDVNMKDISLINGRSIVVSSNLPSTRSIDMSATDYVKRFNDISETSHGVSLWDKINHLKQEMMPSFIDRFIHTDRDVELFTNFIKKIKSTDDLVITNKRRRRPFSTIDIQSTDLNRTVSEPIGKKRKCTPKNI